MTTGLQANIQQAYEAVTNPIVVPTSDNFKPVERAYSNLMSKGSATISEATSFLNTSFMGYPIWIIILAAFIAIVILAAI